MKGGREEQKMKKVMVMMIMMTTNGQKCPTRKKNPLERGTEVGGD